MSNDPARKVVADAMTKNRTPFCIRLRNDLLLDLHTAAAHTPKTMTGVIEDALDAHLPRLLDRIDRLERRVQAARQT